MPDSIKITDPMALAVARDMRAQEVAIGKFQKELRERFQQELNDYMTAAHSQHIEDISRFRLAAGINHSIDGWSIDLQYLDHDAVFISKTQAKEQAEQVEAMAEKVTGNVTEQ